MRRPWPTGGYCGMVKKFSIINIYYHDFTLLTIEGEDDDLDIEDERNSDSDHAALSWQHHFFLEYAN
jgi:hypothetical protein